MDKVLIQTSLSVPKSIGHGSREVKVGNLSTIGQQLASGTHPLSLTMFVDYVRRKRLRRNIVLSSRRIGSLS